MAAPALALALIAAQAHDVDKTVVDIEAPPFRPAFVEVDVAAIRAEAEIAFGRTATEDLIMHCRDEHGPWHRLHPSKPQTACGIPLITGWATRSGRHLNNPLAKCECWTTAERREADERDHPPLA